MRKVIVVLSSARGGGIKIEGQSYDSIRDAESHISLFRDRVVAMNEVNAKHGIDSQSPIPTYWVTTLEDKG